MVMCFSRILSYFLPRTSFYLDRFFFVHRFVLYRFLASFPPSLSYTFLFVMWMFRIVRANFPYTPPSTPYRLPPDPSQNAVFMASLRRYITLLSDCFSSVLSFLFNRTKAAPIVLPKAALLLGLLKSRFFKKAPPSFHLLLLLLSLRGFRTFSPVSLATVATM